MWAFQCDGMNGCPSEIVPISLLYLVPGLQTLSTRFLLSLVSQTRGGCLCNINGAFSSNYRWFLKSASDQDQTFRNNQLQKNQPVWFGHLIKWPLKMDRNASLHSSPRDNVKRKGAGFWLSWLLAYRYRENNWKKRDSPGVSEFAMLSQDEKF